MAQAVASSIEQQRARGLHHVLHNARREQDELMSGVAATAEADADVDEELALLEDRLDDVIATVSDNETSLTAALEKNRSEESVMQHFQKLITSLGIETVIRTALFDKLREDAGYTDRARIDVEKDRLLREFHDAITGIAQDIDLALEQRKNS